MRFVFLKKLYCLLREDREQTAEKREGMGKAVHHSDARFSDEGGDRKKWINPGAAPGGAVHRSVTGWRGRR